MVNVTGSALPQSGPSAAYTQPQENEQERHDTQKRQHQYPKAFHDPKNGNRL